MQVQMSSAIDDLQPADGSTSAHLATIGEIGGDAIRFGRFCAIPHSRQLLMDGKPREIGGRAFDLLMVLLKSNGGIVTKIEIFNEVWPSMVVEECNLRFQVGSLRRALGDNGEIVKTVVRRGYMLVREGSQDDLVPSDAISLDPSFTTVKPATASAIVLIEDDEGVRDAISSLLRSVGLDVTSYSSVRSFEESTLPQAPSCIILDVCLPGTSGLEFQAELQRKGLSYPIIFISGHADVQMCVQAMKAGALEFLTKPVRYQDLLTAVNIAIGRSEGAVY
ncbi:response regulator [Pararhizobium sp. DWP1-1-3]|uniref:response regulator n=1 Tax=Pararhizobium sp. DWP1-1-3 TaxID=2804652 RepID=UPI003CF2431D